MPSGANARRVLLVGVEARGAARPHEHVETGVKRTNLRSLDEELAVGVAQFLRR